jgi:hypothetical protein
VACGTHHLALFEGSQMELTMDEFDSEDRDLRTVELTTRERDLLLKYGYPFSEQEQRLRESKAVKGIHRVRIGAYWIEMMIADLVRSAKEIPEQMRNRVLFEELDALCSALEYALVDDQRKIRLR